MIAIIARRPNNQSNFSRTRKSFAFRPRPKRSIDKARRDRNVASCNKSADSRFEFANFAGRRSCAFRKNNQNRSWISEQFPAKRQALSNTRLSGKRQRVHKYRSGPKPWHALEKIIGGGRRKRAMQFAQRQRREQTKCVDMTTMICNHYERAVCPQILVPDNFEMVVDLQQASNDQRSE